MKVTIKQKRTMGFTLIELMIVVAILGIIAAVALPSYQNYVRDANRAAVKAIIYEGAQFMEQFYTENNRYDQDLTGNAVALPAALSQSPKTGVAQYNIILQPVANATFTLQAIPAGSMAGDVCGTLTLTNTGLQGAGGDVAACWNR